MVMIMSSYAINFGESAAIQIHPIMKHLLAIVLGATVTLGLFFTMYNLIKNDAVPVEAPPTKVMPQLKQTPPDLTPIFEEFDAPVKPVYEQKPETIDDPEPIDTSVINMKPVIPTVFELGNKIKPVIENNNVLPMVRVNPVYPQSLAARGIEGFVDVVFDVTETGSTQNIEVVYAEPERVFNSAVIKAVSRWKYRPKMEDGVAVKMQGVRERIRFNLAK